MQVNFETCPGLYFCETNLMMAKQFRPNVQVRKTLSYLQSDSPFLTKPYENNGLNYEKPQETSRGFLFCHYSCNVRRETDREYNPPLLRDPLFLQKLPVACRRRFPVQYFRNNRQGITTAQVIDHIIDKVKQFINQHPGIYFGFFTKIDQCCHQCHIGLPAIYFHLSVPAGTS